MFPWGDAGSARAGIGVRGEAILHSDRLRILAPRD
jgi:hypothetical protein